MVEALPVSWEVYKMWRVLEKEGAHRRGTFTLCHDVDREVSGEEVLGSKVIIDFDEGTRIESQGTVIVEPWEDQEGKKYPGSIKTGPHDFEIMRELPVTAPTIHQHVVSAPVIPRIGDPKRKKP